MFKKIASFIIGFSIVCSPLFFGLETQALASSGGLAPKCNTKVDNENGGFTDPCGFDTIFSTINKAVSYFVKYLATTVFGVMFAYAGFLYLTSNQKGNIDKAKTIMKFSVYGYLILLVSWLIINTILNFFGYNGPNFLTGSK